MPAVGASDGETKRSGKRLKLVKLVIRAVERDRRASMAVDDAREAKVVSTSTVVKAFRSVCTVSTFLPTVFFGPKIVVKNRGKTTSTFYHDSRFHRTIVRKSSSKTLERGTGFEPATSTLGTRRHQSTTVNGYPPECPSQVERSSVVYMRQCPSVGKSWECGK